MNWLAHLYLSEPDAQFRVGNLLPDLVGRSELANLPNSYQRGIRCHRKIDAFTDTHPRVRACIARFGPPYRRFGGILTDVYFDHFLARDWPRYSSMPLADFIAEVYRDIEICLPEIPWQAARALNRMREEDWLGSYQRITGISHILRLISRRLRRRFDLSGSVPMFTKHESAHSEDFRYFFQELMARVRSSEVHPGSPALSVSETAWPHRQP